MNNLLIFFALPVATIILAGIFETFINCPFKVAGIAFAIYLIVAFALGGTSELIVAAIIYTILALITALFVRYFRNRNDVIDNFLNNNINNSNVNNNNNDNNIFNNNSRCRR